MSNDYQNLAPELREALQMMSEIQPCQIADEVKGLLELTDKGVVRNTMQNVYLVFMCDPVLRGTIGYNILTGRIDLCRALWWERTSSVLNDTDFNYLMLCLEKQYDLNNENQI